MVYIGLFAQSDDFSVALESVWVARLKAVFQK